MIGLDTNVLVPCITQDDPQQSAQATQLIETRCTPAAPGHVAQIVLCELVRVLRRTYGYSKHQVKNVLDQILVTAELAVENDSLAFHALDAYREGSADFSDYLLVLSNRAAGCETTYSFDVRLPDCRAFATPLPLPRANGALQPGRQRRARGFSAGGTRVSFDACRATTGALYIAEDRTTP